MTATTTPLGYDDLPALLTRLTGDEKHDRSSFSTLDAIWVLYDRVLREGDRFLLSKGHGPAAFYAVLAAKGILRPVLRGRDMSRRDRSAGLPRPKSPLGAVSARDEADTVPYRSSEAGTGELLDGFGGFDSPLGHHPDRKLVNGVEISSGSLGHGLGIAVGSALTGRRVFCLVGDAELEEGSNWEAVQFAGRAGLASLTAVVIDNASSTHGWPEGVERRFALEGWAAVRVDGRDHEELAAALEPDRDGTRPRCVVAEVEPR